MAAEYTLYTKNEIDSETAVVNILYKLDWINKREKIGDNTTLFSFNDAIGFILYLSSGFKSSIDLCEDHFDFRNRLRFRFLNEIYFLTSKKNMIRFIIEMNKVFNDDFLLLFNDEIVTMVKNGEEDLIISTSDFWNDELLLELKGLVYTRRAFKVL